MPGPKSSFAASEQGSTHSGRLFRSIRPPIPGKSKNWPDSTGIGGRFQSEQVAGFFRNRWPDFTGIRTIRRIERSANPGRFHG